MFGPGRHGCQTTCDMNLVLGSLPGFWLLHTEDSTIMPAFEVSHRDGAHIPATAVALVLEWLAPVFKWPHGTQRTASTWKVFL